MKYRNLIVTILCIIVGGMLVSGGYVLIRNYNITHSPEYKTAYDRCVAFGDNYYHGNMVANKKHCKCLAFHKVALYSAKDADRYIGDYDRYVIGLAQDKCRHVPMFSSFRN